jgi:hypothetical protein
MFATGKSGKSTIFETILVSIGTEEEATFNRRHLKPLSDPALNMKKEICFLLILSPTFNVMQ